MSKSMVLTKDEVVERKKDFCLKYGVSELDILVSSYDIPVVLQDSLEFKDVEPELWGHPCFWLPKEIRLQRPDERTLDYVARIVVVLNALGYFRGNGNWIDVIYDKVQLDVLDDEILLRGLMDDMEWRDSLMFSDSILDESDSLFVTKGKELVATLTKLNESSGEALFHRVMSHVHEGANFPELEAVVSKTKDLALAYHTATSWAIVDSGLREDLSELLESFRFWFLATLREDLYVDLWAAERDYDNFEETYLEVIESTLAKTVDLKKELDALEARFFNTNGKAEFASVLKKMIMVTKALSFDED